MLNNRDKRELIRLALKDETIQKFSSRKIGRMFGVNDKFVGKYRQIFMRQIDEKQLPMVHRKITRMLIGDAIYRLDQDGFGWRLEYVEFALETMAYKYILYNREQIVGKVDIRSKDGLIINRHNIANACVAHGFTAENSFLVVGGAISSYKPNEMVINAPSFDFYS